MPLYIKFDSTEEENLAIERFSSFALLYATFKNDFKTSGGKFVIFKELPLHEYNENLFYENVEHITDAIKSFEKFSNKNNFGMEIKASCNIGGEEEQLTFMLLPEKDTKKEVPDVMIDITDSKRFENIDGVLIQKEYRQALMRMVNNFKEQATADVLKIKRLKVTLDDEAVSPIGTLVYYSHPKEYVIDNVRLAKKYSLKRSLDLANEAKIGTIISNNKLAQERLAKLMKQENIQRESGSIWLFSQDENQSRKLYELFEKEILSPIAQTFPSRSKVNNAIAKQSEFKAKK